MNFPLISHWMLYKIVLRNWCLLGAEDEYKIKQQDSVLTFLMLYSEESGDLINCIVLDTRHGHHIKPLKSIEWRNFIANKNKFQKTFLLGRSCALWIGTGKNFGCGILLLRFHKYTDVYCEVLKNFWLLVQSLHQVIIMCFGILSCWLVVQLWHVFEQAINTYFALHAATFYVKGIQLFMFC